MNILTIFCNTGNSSGNIYLLWLILAIIVINLTILLSWLYYSRRREKDIEEKIKQRTEELVAVINSLGASQYELQQQSDFQKKIIAAIVHGIKSPLKYLSLTGRQLHNRAEFDESMRDIIGSMYTSSHHLYTFTDNLLQYVKLYLRESKPVAVSFNLHELVDEKVAIFRDIATAKGSVINNHIHPRMSMYTDRQLLSIIVHNLIDNAVKYTADGVITFSAFITENRVHLAVQDTGIGMDEVVIEQLYNNGVNYEPGLGLTIARQLLGMINGSLEIRSRAGEGTSAIIIFDQQPLASI